MTFKWLIITADSNLIYIQITLFIISSISTAEYESENEKPINKIKYVTQVH